uniref:Uncharacterized protein LOC111115632 n=1 Tax=Crassostrea virginica TaxID=6565 RepID=A0A8B8C5G8_CRAVI|nr:uncharacterized protein LOC111115632 [Crassostrea virginica]XP_022310157.1 uncharacterized protein LOC111115632 [Crassostrea virginica]
MVKLLSGMATTAMEVTISVSLVVTIGLWLSAMFTTGWFLASIRSDNTTTYPLELKMSLFEMKLCNIKSCSMEFPEKAVFIFDSTFPSVTERQLMSITALALSGICCILVMLSEFSLYKNQTKELVIIFLSFISVVFEVILVIRMVIFVSRMSQTFDTNSKFLKEFDRSNGRIHDFPIIHKFPFPILIAFLGCLVGTTGCILRIIQLVSVRRNREHGSLSTDQTAPTPIGLTNLQENGQTHDGTMQTSTP